MQLFDKIQSPDEILNRIQDRIKAAFNAVARRQIVDGRLTDALSLTTSFQNIAHGLGRTPNGWLVSNPDADVGIWSDAVANNPDPAKFLRIRATAAVTCKLWVF